MLRLLELAPEVCELLEKRTIEMGHARALLALTQRRQQTEVGLLVAKKSLSVRETEALVRRLQARPAADRPSPPLPVTRTSSAWSRSWRRNWVPASPSSTAAGQGQAVVSYNSLDELDGISRTSNEAESAGLRAHVWTHARRSL